VALEAIRGDETIAEIAAQHEVRPNQVTEWKTQVLIAPVEFRLHRASFAYIETFRRAVRGQHWGPSALR
jgi:hypothetical protein